MTVEADQISQWTCLYCGYVYDVAIGAPESGIPSGTLWDDIPDDWCCPNCSSEKSQFEPL